MQLFSLLGKLEKNHINPGPQSPSDSAEELVKNDSLSGARMKEIVTQSSGGLPEKKFGNGQAQTPQIDLPVTVGQSSTLAAKYIPLPTSTSGWADVHG
tara:strand:+ start:1961 stop:2254 length:294 start_codon:yes stop_codon:yes gene_type:complete